MNDFRQNFVIVPAAFVPTLASARFVRDSPRHDVRNAIMQNTCFTHLDALKLWICSYVLGDCDIRNWKILLC